MSWMMIGDRHELVLSTNWAWVRLYVGGTMDQRRLWRWSFESLNGKINHGVTLRLLGERCIGAQWRRA